MTIIYAKKHALWHLFSIILSKDIVLLCLPLIRSILRKASKMKLWQFLVFLAFKGSLFWGTIGTFWTKKA